MVFPSLLHMSLVKAQVQESICVGAQNVSSMEPGAFTGEVSADHIRDYGIEYVLIGHSERCKH
jgi:triosephosphate isomerase